MRLFSCLLLILSLTACSHTDNETVSSSVSRLAKSDIDEVAEIHQKVVINHLKNLMIKLYKRNPAMQHDRDEHSIEDSVRLTFAMPYNVRYQQWHDIEHPDDMIRMAFDIRFKGDRVRAFILALREMLMASYGNQTTFYYFTEIDQQKLYNSARNIEIAAWLLSEKQYANGQPIIFSDSLETEQRNLSFQRILGQMIATQDNLAKIIAEKNGRIIKTAIVNSATMLFFPI